MAVSSVSTARSAHSRIPILASRRVETESPTAPPESPGAEQSALRRRACVWPPSVRFATRSGPGVRVSAAWPRTSRGNLKGAMHDKFSATKLSLSSIGGATSSAAQLAGNAAAPDRPSLRGGSSDVEALVRQLVPGDACCLPSVATVQACCSSAAGLAVPCALLAAPEQHARASGLCGSGGACRRQPLRSRSSRARARLARGDALLCSYRSCTCPAALRPLDCPSQIFSAVRCAA
jgi:hypothetical protein